MNPLAFVTRHQQTFLLALISLLVASSPIWAQTYPANIPSPSDPGLQRPVTMPPLTIRPGTILTVRINEELSSDRNQPGDLFSATLTQPVVVQGMVVAQRGSTVAGRVVEAKKAGMVAGVSHLGITLSSLSLVDGQDLPIQSQLVVRRGPTSNVRDVAAVTGTTALGAAIGGAVGGGKGAGIGAGAGAATGALGVLLTRGYPTVLPPETLLTFQVTAPATVDTEYAPEAFRGVASLDYSQAPAQPEQPPADQTTPPATAAPPPAVASPPPAYPYPYYLSYWPPSYPYYYYGYPYYWGYPYYYGPSFSFFFGYPGYYGYRGYYGYPYYGYRGYYRYPTPYYHGYGYRGSWGGYHGYSPGYRPYTGGHPGYYGGYRGSSGHPYTAGSFASHGGTMGRSSHGGLHR